MKKKISIVLAVVLAAAIALSLTACSAAGGVKKTLRTFEKACNDLNVEAALATVDPAVAGVLKLGTGLLGTLTGKTDEELFSALSAALGAHSDALGIASFKTLKIKTGKVTTSGDTAYAAVNLTYTGLTGQEESRDAVVKLRQSEKTWYITGIDF